MGEKFKIMSVVSCFVFFAACGGSEKAASDDSSGETSVSPVGGSEPSAMSGNSGTDTTVPLFDGFSVDDSLSSNGSGTIAAKEKLIFTAPQDCMTTPTAGTTEDFVEALYRNCLYRPINADSNQSWVKRINEDNKIGREQAREGVYDSPEARCIRGETDSQDTCSGEIAAAQEYEIVCDVDSFIESYADSEVVYGPRAGQRIKILCPEIQIETVE